MKYMAYHKDKVDEVLVKISGVILIGLFITGSIYSRICSNNLSKNITKPKVCNTRIGCNLPKGTISLEDLGLVTKYHHTLDVIIQAEDPELWEIEHFNGNYYKVRREDYDDEYYGHYEFDTEEPIGDVEDLYRYVKQHNIRPVSLH